MVSGYVQNGCFCEAIPLFREFKTRYNVNLKGSHLVSVLNTCASVGAFEEVKWVYLCLNKNGSEYGLQLGTALIDFMPNVGVSEMRKKYLTKCLMTM